MPEVALCDNELSERLLWVAQLLLDGPLGARTHVRTLSARDDASQADRGRAGNER